MGLRYLYQTSGAYITQVYGDYTRPQSGSILTNHEFLQSNKGLEYCLLLSGAFSHKEGLNHIYIFEVLVTICLFNVQISWVLDSNLR